MSGAFGNLIWGLCKVQVTSFFNNFPKVCVSIEIDLFSLRDSGTLTEEKG